MRVFPLQLFLVSLLALCFACEESKIDPPTDLDEQPLFPLAVGLERTYAVDSIILVPVVNGTRYDTALLEAREVLVESFTDPAGQLWYRGERYEKDRGESDDAYRITRTFTVSIDQGVAIRREDNLSFSKLVFPARSGTRWAPNRDFDAFRQLPVGGEFLDIYAGWEANYTTVDTVFQLSPSSTPQRAVRVELADQDNVIDLRRAYEVYADGLGLVEQFIDARHTQCQVCCGGETGPCIDLSWDAKAEKGFILRQTLIE